jgi:hypothetical protein
MRAQVPDFPHCERVRVKISVFPQGDRMRSGSGFPRGDQVVQLRKPNAFAQVLVCTRDSPGDLMRTKKSQGELWREPRIAQERPGEPKRVQDSPGEPRKAQESTGESKEIR